jgi:DNA-binding response OmpR family regulator
VTQQSHVLIVEDSSLVVDALRLLLEEHGYSVAVADSIDSARAATAQRRPHVVLLDLALPDGDGLSLVGEWLGDGCDKEPSVVLALTGHADEQTRRRCLQAGCSDVLVKPVATSELIRRLGATTT